jgi:[NiFe] hydrogenase diaphorase moiety large subunit
MGTPDSAGTRLLSVAGDCDRPGVYEVEWGVTLDEVLTMVCAHDAHAVQISGPSGECLSVEADVRRRIAYEDIPCNGAVTIFNSTRDLLDCVKDYTKFFADESCGICVPCRAGTADLHNKAERIRAGAGTQKDVDDAASWGALVRTASRCGLGATAANPLLTTLEKFPEIYRSRLRTREGALRLSFDLDAALAGYDTAVTELETDGTA